MKRLALACVLLLVLVHGLRAQSDRKALLELEAAAGSIPSKLMEVARFAKDKGLKDDEIRLYFRVLAEDAEHEAANKALGHEKDERGWFAMFDGVRVESANAQAARRGVFFHDGQRVTHWEKARLLKGYVRHPKTGLLIEPTHAEDAGRGLFPVADGKWVGVADANRYHASTQTPWAVRTKGFYIVTTLSYDKITEISTLVDEVTPWVRRVLGGAPLEPARRPVVYVLPTTDLYTGFGAEYGDQGSSHGAFFASARQFVIEIEGVRRPVAAANYGVEGWRPYYIRHAAGLAMVRSYLGDEADAVPEWFHRGLAGHCSRLFRKDITAFFGKQHLNAGMPESIAEFLSGFKISSENPRMGRGTNDYNLFQAGALIEFCIRGGDQACTDAMLKVSEAVAKHEGIAASVRRLQEVLGTKTTEINAFVEALAR